MGQSKIRKALIAKLVELDLDLDLSFPNTKTEYKVPYGDVSIVFNQPEVSTLGVDGEDYHDGFLQVLLKYPVGMGDQDILEMADSISDQLTAGTKCTYDDQEVVIQNCGVGGFLYKENIYITPLTINWYAHTRR